MLTWTLTTSLFHSTSSMQSIPTSRIMVISQAGLPSGHHSRRWEPWREHQCEIPSGGHAPSHHGPCDLRTWCGDRAFPCRLWIVLKGNHPNRRVALQHVLYTCCQLWQPTRGVPPAERMEERWSWLWEMRCCTLSNKSAQLGPQLSLGF